MSDAAEPTDDYQRDDVQVPRLSGLPLRALVATLESPGLGPAVVERLLLGSGLGRFRAADAGHASPIQVALPHPPAPPSTAGALDAALGLPPPAADLETTAACIAAFDAGRSDPLAVAHRACAAIDRLDGPEASLGIFIAHRREQVLADAAAAATRRREGRARSPLDGVPVVVKDELDVAGFPTTLGTKIRDAVATVDAVVVARLRAAGAIVLGKANMNEIGISPVGLNPHHGPARNPWHRGHITGGSSSGSAAAVAAGLCPIAIGADGGGSIRIPAALCGVVGLKATFGRIPETGVPPLCWNVGHVGPLGLTVADVAAAYAVIAGPDDGDPASLAQPAPHLHALGTPLDLRGVRLGVCRPYVADASDDVAAVCQAAIDRLVARGATVVELPAPDLNTILWAHAIIILSEMATAMLPVRDRAADFALDSRTNLAFGRHFRATDLVHAMRHRQRITVETIAQLRGVDAIVTPTCAITAPAIPEATLPAGESNLPVVDQLMRFVRVANLTGLPALSVPCGFDRAGLPIGLQLMGRAYDEVTLLRLGALVEADAPRRTPAHHATLLR